MCDLLARAVSNREGKLALPVKTSADPVLSKVLDFLVEQGWLDKAAGDETWTVTPSGRFWLESLDYGAVVTFHEYGGTVFLLNTRSNASETIVWHKGRFATISIAHGPHPEHFEVRRENEAHYYIGRIPYGGCAGRCVRPRRGGPRRSATAEARGSQAAYVEVHGAVLKLPVARGCLVLRHECVPFALVVDRTPSEQAE